MTPLERANEAVAVVLGVGGVGPIEAFMLADRRMISVDTLARAVLQAIREPISDAIDYLIADAEAWETGAKDAAHEVYLMHCGKLRRDVAARLQAMIDAALEEGAGDDEKVYPTDSIHTDENFAKVQELASRPITWGDGNGEEG